MSNRFSKMLAAAGRTIKEFPVEMGIVLYAFVIGVLMINDVDLANEENIALAPLFFALAYSLNNLVKCPRGRRAYYLCWLPIVPLWWVDVGDWVESSGFVVALACAFLAFLVCRKACDNRRFAYESLNYLFDLVVSFCFAGISHLLLMGIYFSTTYIFHLEDDVIPHFYEYLALLTYGVFVPLLFLSFVRGNVDREVLPGKIFEILLNYILTPALLIYTVILYVYFVTIAIRWELPEGGIAIMVFIFTLIAVVVKAWQPLLGRRHYDWYYDRFSLFSLPAIVMFWIGSIYRITQYGFTEWRFYLVLCGVIMTVALAMFAFRGRGKYITVALLAMGLLAVFTFIPPISAKNLSIASQECRIGKLAGKIGLLDAEGKIVQDERPQSDTVFREDYHKLYESLDYLDDHDRPLYGLESPSDIKDIFPGKWEADPESASRDDYITVFRVDSKAVDIAGFITMCRPTSWKNDDNDFYYTSGEDDSLKVYKRVPLTTDEENQEPQWEEVFGVGLDTIMERMMTVAAPLPAGEISSEFLEKQRTNLEFFIYDAEGMRILFSNIGFKKADGEWKISDIAIEYILLK